MTIDELVFQANFGAKEEKALAQLQIWQQAMELQIVPCSILDLYLAKGRNEISQTFTVPAINLRGLSYHLAQAAFKAAQQTNTGILIFELARSEMDYTDQPPLVYASNILAAAIKTGWNKPIFLQGDHYQTKDGSDEENSQIEKLVKESIKAGFYNLDFDGSKLIDLTQPSTTQQQAANALFTAKMAQIARQEQPEGITVSIGAEITPIGSSQNSSPEELDGLMSTFLEKFPEQPGLSKVAIQTGTTHGGLVDTQGKVIKASVSFDTITQMSNYARTKYGMGGIVQHGASTLETDMFSQFPPAQAIEIHLSTGFQNAIFDHPAFPTELKQEIFTWLDKNRGDKRKPDQTAEQFYYQERKKAWKPFKQQIWEIPEPILNSIKSDLEETFRKYFTELQVADTTELLSSWITPVAIEKKLADFMPTDDIAANDTSGLAD